VTALERVSAALADWRKAPAADEGGKR